MLHLGVNLLSLFQSETIFWSFFFFFRNFNTFDEFLASYLIEWPSVLGLLDVSLWLNSDCTFLARILQKWCALFTIIFLRHMMLRYLINGDINSDHLIKMMSAGFCTIKLRFFLLKLSILWGDTWRLCKYSVCHHAFAF